MHWLRVIRDPVMAWSSWMHVESSSILSGCLRDDSAPAPVVCAGLHSAISISREDLLGGIFLANGHRRSLSLPGDLHA